MNDELNTFLFAVHARKHLTSAQLNYCCYSHYQGSPTSIHASSDAGVASEILLGHKGMYNTLEFVGRSWLSLANHLTSGCCLISCYRYDVDSVDHISTHYVVLQGLFFLRHWQVSKIILTKKHFVQITVFARMLIYLHLFSSSLYLNVAILIDLRMHRRDALANNICFFFRAL